MSKFKINPSNLANLIHNEAKKLSGAAFTVKSKMTGKEFTYKISNVFWKGYNYLHVKVEKEYLNFAYMGYYREGNVFQKQNNVATKIDTPARDAISWILRQLYKGNISGLDSNIEVYHLGKCLRCGKTLTDSESIQRGFGPVCKNI